MNQFGIDEDELEIVLSVLKRYDGIEKAVIFGSRAKGNYEEYSDIDIAIFSKENLAGEILTDFDEELLIYKVDIISYNHISSQALKEHIDRVGKIIYEKH